MEDTFLSQGTKVSSLIHDRADRWRRYPLSSALKCDWSRRGIGGVWTIKVVEWRYFVSMRFSRRKLRRGLARKITLADVVFRLASDHSRTVSCARSEASLSLVDLWLLSSFSSLSQHDVSLLNSDGWTTLYSYRSTVEYQSISFLGCDHYFRVKLVAFTHY